MWHPHLTEKANICPLFAHSLLLTIVGYSINDRAIPLLLYFVIAGFGSLLQSVEFIGGARHEIS